MSKLIQFVDQLKAKIYSVPYYPVGSIFITVDSTNPSKWFGGTWASFGSGKTLVGVDTSQTEFSTVQKTGGEKTHTLTTEEMPTHGHGIYTGPNKGSISGDGILSDSGGNSNFNRIAVTNNAGGGKAHNNLQPYITVYFWRKTAM